MIHYCSWFPCLIFLLGIREVTASAGYCRNGTLVGKTRGKSEVLHTGLPSTLTRNIDSVTNMAAEHGFDIRQIPKPEGFSGKDEDWLEWTFTFRSYGHCIDLGEGMDHASRMATEPEMLDMTPQAESKSKMLYHLLVQLLKGKARKLAMQMTEPNGFGLWWRLH